MNDENALALQAGSTSTVELPDIGTGIQRTSGTYIALLLSLEDTREERASIIANVCEHLGMKLEDIAAYRDWEKAGGWTQPHTMQDVYPPKV